MSLSNKRPRMKGSSYLTVRSIDGCIFKADVDLFAHWQLRFSKVLQTEPQEDENGEKCHVWCLSGALFLTLVQSMTFGRLVVATGATLAEALSMFDYEGVVMPHRRRFSRSLQQDAAGIAFVVNNESLSCRVDGVCEDVTDAIVSWPMLVNVLESVLNVNFNTYDVDVSTDSVWITFINPPVYGDFRDVQHLLQVRPQWLDSGILALGNIAAKKSIDLFNIENKEKHQNLEELLFAGETINSLYHVRFDVHVQSLKKAEMKDRLLSELLLASVYSSMETKSTDTSKKKNRQMAYEIIRFVKKQHDYCASYGSMFGDF